MTSLAFRLISLMWMQSLTLWIVMPNVRYHTSKMRMDVWPIRQHVRTVHRRQAWPRSRMSRMPSMQTCTMIMPDHVIMIIDVDITPEEVRLSSIRVLGAYVHMPMRRRNPRLRWVQTLQILRWLPCRYCRPWFQSRQWCYPRLLFYDAPLQSNAKVYHIFI